VADPFSLGELSERMSETTLSRLKADLPLTANSGHWAHANNFRSGSDRDYTRTGVKTPLPQFERMKLSSRQHTIQRCHPSTSYVAGSHRVV
jgi:hypothetical protein